MSEETHLVFVYGTLRRGASNAFRMEGAEWLYPGFVKGRLYKVDWYPAVVLDEAGGKVEGELWRVSEDQLRELDAFEGDEYRRRKVTVFSGHSARGVNEWDGDQAEAWIWEWKGEVDSLEPIQGGNWMRIETTKPRKLYTFMGCLSLFAIPIGGVVIANFVSALIRWNSTAQILFGAFLLVSTPIVALVFVVWADRQGESGEGWRELTKVVSFVWILVASLVLISSVLELLLQ